MIDANGLEGFSPPDLPKGAVKLKISREALRSKIVQRIQEMSGENLASCYQCGKCSAGCPFAGEMEMLPHQVVRLLQLGQQERALKTEAIWLCASCHTCAARCPRGLDLSRSMEALRLHWLREGLEQVGPYDLSAEVLAEAPQQAIVSCYRKYSR